MSSAGCKSPCQPVTQDKPFLIHVHTSHPAVASSSKHILQTAALRSNAEIQPMQMQSCSHLSCALCLPLSDCEQCMFKDPLPGTALSPAHDTQPWNKMDMGRKANLLRTAPTAGWPGMCHCWEKADQSAVAKVPPTRALIWQESCSSNCTTLKTSQVRGKRPIWSRLKTLLLGEWGVQTSTTQASQVARSWTVMLSSHWDWSEPDPAFLWLTKFPFQCCSGRQAMAILPDTCQPPSSYPPDKKQLAKTQLFVLISLLLLL